MMNRIAGDILRLAMSVKYDSLERKMLRLRGAESVHTVLRKREPGLVVFVIEVNGEVPSGKVWSGAGRLILRAGGEIDKDETLIDHDLVKIGARGLLEGKTARTAAYVKNQYDGDYKALIRLAKTAIPWESRPYMSKQSAMHGMEGEVSGNEVGLYWHRPDQSWGPNWVFLGMTVGNEWLFTGTGENAAKDKPLPDRLQRRNVKDFKRAIDYLKEMGQ
jgi:hypothetical protein